MECRRWAPTCDAAGFLGFLFEVFDGRWIDGLGLATGFCRDAGMLHREIKLDFSDFDLRIVEYATREQAQQAVNTLSNQNLMGRLVYVREVSRIHSRRKDSIPIRCTALLIPWPILGS